MFRRSSFVIILLFLGIICLVFFGLLLSPLRAKIFNSSQVTSSTAAPTSAARSLLFDESSVFSSATPAPKIKYDKGLTWTLYDSNSSQYAGVGEGATSPLADQKTEPPRPTY